MTTYFKIGTNDYSRLVNGLKITHDARYTAQTNAAGNTVVDYINSKRTIEVGIIPLDANTMASLLSDIEKFDVKISFRNPQTGGLEENVHCMIPSHNVEYYTIRADKVSFNKFTLKFIEL